MKNSNKTLALFLVALFVVSLMVGVGVNISCQHFNTSPKAIVTSVLSHFSKSSKPDETVKGFMNSLQKQDIEKAVTYVKNGDMSVDFDSPEQKEIGTQIISKLKYEVISTTTDGDKAKVKTKITAPNLRKITAKVILELIPDLLDDVISGRKDNKEVDKRVNKYLMNSLKDPKVQMITSEVDINLVKDKEKNTWLIVGDDDLVNGFTGGLLKASEDIEKSMKN